MVLFFRILSLNTLHHLAFIGNLLFQDKVDDKLLLEIAISINACDIPSAPSHIVKECASTDKLLFLTILIDLFTFTSLVGEVKGNGVLGTEDFAKTLCNAVGILFALSECTCGCYSHQADNKNPFHNCQ